MIRMNSQGDVGEMRHDEFLVEHGIEPSEGLNKFFEFVKGDALLVAHNAKIDIRMIGRTCAKNGIEGLPEDVLVCDTWHLVKTLAPGLENYQLATLIDEFHVDAVNSHDAMDDVLGCAGVFFQALADWRESGSSDSGELSALAVRAMQDFGRRYPRAGYGGHFAQWISEDDPRPYNSWGNGAAMRVSACGWAGRTLDEVKAMSRAVTEVTHNHPEGVKGAEATAACVFLARQGKSKDEIKAYVSEHYYPLDFTLDEIRPSYDFDVSCQGSVPQALEAFFESTSFEDAIRNAISIGGDSDTIGAIGGAVAEAFYGVPNEIRTKAMTFLPQHLANVLDRVEAVFG